VRWRGEENGVAVESKVAAGLAPLWADETRLKQILVNLLDNAIKFTPKGGRVTVEAGPGADGGIVFTVADTGVGMAPDDIPRALAAFGQVDNSLSRQHQGVGLGLPLVKKLTELHGGRFDIRSRPGHGTTITIAFPAARTVTAPPARDAARA